MEQAVFLLLESVFYTFELSLKNMFSGLLVIFLHTWSSTLHEVNDDDDDGDDAFEMLCYHDNLLGFISRHQC